MKRRSKAAGEPNKAQRRKAPKPKHRDALKAAPRSNSSAAGQQAEIARLSRELHEALEQQTAASEVLDVISSSPGELEQVFLAILKKATRICEAKFGWVHRYDGQLYHPAAQVGATTEVVEFHKRRGPFLPDAGGVLDQVIRTKHVSYTSDIAAETSRVAAANLSGARSTIAVPMLKDETLLGALVIYRQEVRPFTEKQIALVTTFAKQAVIAIENSRLLSELRLSLEQQTATSEVLHVISSSPGDLQPVFATMLEKAVRICYAKFGTLYLHEDGHLRLVAAHDVPEFLQARGSSPIQPAPGGVLDGAMRTRRTVHVPDLSSTQSYAERHPRMVDAVEVGGIRTVVAVPMLKDDDLIGVLAVHRREVRPFNDKQIALLENFASQAVIAIENARLLNELRQRTTDLTECTADLTEALERQTATSEVLKIISSSPGDLQPVFDAMLSNATRICQASLGNLALYENGAYRVVALHGAPATYKELRAREPFFVPNPAHPLGRLVNTKQVLHVADILSEPPQARGGLARAGARTLLNVPMLKEQELVGSFGIYRQEVRPFSEKEIGLVQNFAAQAVIAIENARLLNELRQRTDDLTEALEQQTATSEVLQVISSSPGDLNPVFAAMLASATRICEAEFGNLFLREEDAFRAVAWHGEPTYVNTWRGPALTIKTDIAEDSPLARLAVTKQRVHVADVRQEAAYKAGHEHLVALIDKGGARTLLIVPMLKEHTLVGAIAIYRQEVRPFADKQIALLENFAAQAVIAIENARLLRELRERTGEIEKLNKHLEQRVAEQVGEIERMGRLRRFLPPQVADLIVASGTEKQLESHRRPVSPRASDPEDVMALLRDYHGAIGEIIIEYSGTLERYAGDGVMVVFNDPVPVDNPALQAVLMALEMRDAIGALTEKWRRLGHDIGFGIGIAHGFATLGTIGFEGASTMLPSARYPMLPLGYAMKRSRGRS